MDNTHGISKELMEMSLNALCDILKENFSKQLKLPYIIKCLDNLQK